jgi:hypothetical protein
MRKSLHIILIISSFYCYSQDRFFIPKKTKENKVKSCTIYKVTKFQDQEKDSILEKFASLEYNSAGKETRLSSFRKDSVLDYEETYKYDSLIYLIELTTRDYPDMTFYGGTPVGEFGKHMYEELHYHNRHRKEVNKYDNKWRLIEKKYCSESFDIEDLNEKDVYLKDNFEYNNKGKLIAFKKLYRSDKDIFEVGYSETYEYNLNNNLSKLLSKEKNDNPFKEEYNYNGSEKLISVQYFNSGNKPYTAKRYSYDTHGNKLSFTREDAKGEVYSNYKYKYQDTLLIEVSFNDGKGTSNSIDSYKYDANNSLIWESNWKLDGNGYYTSPNDPYKVKIRKYDKDSNIIEEKRFYDKKRKKDYTGKSEYFYNSLKQVIIEKKYEDNDSLREIYLYHYNQLGQKVKILIFDKDSVLENTEINFYDSLGIRTSRELYYPNNKMQLLQRYEYNAKGKEIGGIFFQRGPKTTIKEYHYILNGLFNIIDVKSSDEHYFYNHVYSYY